MEFWGRRTIRVNIVGAALTVVLWMGFAWAGYRMLPLLGIPSLWQPQALYLSLAVAVLLVTRLYDRMPLAWTGLGINRGSTRELLTGLAFGIGMAAVACLPVAAAGRVQTGVIAPGTMLTFGLYIVSLALGEEILSRGYLYQRAVEMFGVTVATVTVSVVFALAHLSNPSVSAFGLVNTLIAGIFFALCYLRTGSLWMPVGAHAGWNLAVALIFGLPLSGVNFGASLLSTTSSGPDFITGGAYGPEGGCLATLALAIGILVLLRPGVASAGPRTYATVFWAHHAKRDRP